MVKGSISLYLPLLYPLHSLFFFLNLAKTLYFPFLFSILISYLSVSLCHPHFHLLFLPFSLTSSLYSLLGSSFLSLSLSPFQRILLALSTLNSILNSLHNFPPFNLALSLFPSLSPNFPLLSLYTKHMYCILYILIIPGI